jgi:hypothetical protein
MPMLPEVVTLARFSLDRPTPPVEAAAMDLPKAGSAPPMHNRRSTLDVAGRGVALARPPSSDVAP